MDWLVWPVLGSGPLDLERGRLLDAKPPVDPHLERVVIAHRQEGTPLRRPAGALGPHACSSGSKKVVTKGQASLTEPLQFPNRRLRHTNHDEGG